VVVRLQSEVPLDGCIVRVITHEDDRDPCMTVSERYIQQPDGLVFVFMERCWSASMSVKDLHASAIDPQSCAAAVMRRRSRPDAS
jgi:hypothetical protein